jgi:hypothetical protein
MLPYILQLYVEEKALQITHCLRSATENQKFKSFQASTMVAYQRSYFGFVQHVVIKCSDASGKHTAFIFRVPDLGQADAEELQRNQSVTYIQLSEDVWLSSYGRWEKETG